MEENSTVSPWRYLLFGLIGIGALIGLSALLTEPAKSAPLSELSKLEEEVFLPSVQLDNFCSGTIIYSDRDKESGKVSTAILSAKHCTEKLDQRIPIAIDTYDKHNRRTARTEYDAKVVGRCYKSDVSIIKLDDQNTLFKTAKIAPKETNESLKFGQDVFISSFPKGGTKTFTIGTLGYVENIEAFKSISNSVEFYRVTPDIAPGSSGSGVFQNTTGNYELIGLMTGQYSGFTFMNLMTPIEEIYDCLDVMKSLYEVNKEEKKETTVK